MAVPRCLSRGIRGSARAALAVLALRAGAAAAASVSDPIDLQQAVLSVQDGGTIELGPGTYVAPAGGFALGGLGKGFTIEAARPGTVVLDGLGLRPIAHILNTAQVSTWVTFRDLRFRRGRGTLYADAGAVSLVRANAVFERCSFDDNVAETGSTGGGAVLLSARSTAIVRDSVFVENRAGSEGGAIVVYDDSTLTVERSQFVANRVNAPGHRTSSAGGAIAILNGTATIDRSRFQGNEAGFAGGAVYAYGAWTTPTSVPRTRLTIGNSTFEGNRVEPALGVIPDSVPQGGAIHVEDQATLTVRSSRFLSNQADAGGGVNAYRAIVDIEDSTFRGNRATGQGLATGFGGAIGLLSGDLPHDGLSNRRAGALSVARSLIQCAWGGSTVAGQIGGGLFASGDRNRLFGIGVVRLGTAASNRAQVSIDRVAVVDCEVVESQPATGEGGGFEMSLVDLTFRDSIVAGNRASGPHANGGAGRVVFDSVARFDHATFAFNSADRFGGGLAVLGSTADVTASTFTGNEVGSGGAGPVADSLGAAVFAAPIVDFEGEDLEVAGSVSGNLFSGNAGLVLVDDDRSAGPINDVRYDANRFHESSFGELLYANAVAGGPVDLGGLDALVVERDAGVPSTDKSATAGVFEWNAIVTGAMLAVPSFVPVEAATGDPPDLAQAFLVYVWSGAPAAVDGIVVSGGVGLTAAGPGRHTLTVAGQQFHATVGSGDRLFADGFETGALDAWSATVP